MFRHGGWKQQCDVFVEKIFDAIEALRSMGKRPDCISIHIYITRHKATNLDEKAVPEVY